MHFLRTCLLASAAAAMLAACGGSDDSESPLPPSNNVGVLSVTKIDGRYHSGKDAQISNFSAKSALNLAQVQPQRIVLPALDLSKQSLEDDAPGIMKIAHAQTVTQAETPEKFAQLLQWTKDSQGQSNAALTLTATDSFGIRLGLLVHALPEQAMVHTYTAQGKQVHSISGKDILNLIERNVAAGDTSAQARTWWSPDLGGDNVTLQIVLPAGVSPDAVQLALPSISNAFIDSNTLVTAEEAEAAAKETIPSAQSCNLDTTCFTNGSEQRDAVARMRFVKDGGGYFCTGTLLNDAIGSNIPYFVTANHCISTQTVASTLETDWFFRSATCNGSSVDQRRTTRTGGAQLLYSSTVSQGEDMTLMALYDAAPAGTYLAGWDAQLNNTQQDVYGIHHPAGSLSKISGGATTSYGECGSNGCYGNSQGRFYEIVWSEGTTQQGSSGSALFTYSNHFIGTLFGGRASCSAQSSPDYYGRFDLAFENGMKNYLAASQRPL